MFARTERLLLRPGWPEDAPALAAALGEEAVVRNLAWVPWPYTKADAADWLALPVEERLPRLLIFVRGGRAPRLAGGVGLHRAADGEVELGYWVRRDLWGAGIATEAGRAVIDTARVALRMPRLIAVHAVDNPASGRVLRKLGFRQTGCVTERHSLGRRAMVPSAELVLDLTNGNALRLAA